MTKRRVVRGVVFFALLALNLWVAVDCSRTIAAIAGVYLQKPTDNLLSLLLIAAQIPLMGIALFYLSMKVMELPE